MIGSPVTSPLPAPDLGTPDGASRPATPTLHDGADDLARGGGFGSRFVARDDVARLQDAELALEGTTDVRPVSGAGAVLGPGRRVEPLAEPILLVAGERGSPAEAGPLGEGLDAPRIVPRDPGPDRAGAAVEGRGDLLGGPALLGEDDGLVPPPGPAPSC
jgi:hypothetical protein